VSNDARDARDDVSVDLGAVAELQRAAMKCRVNDVESFITRTEPVSGTEEVGVRPIAFPSVGPDKGEVGRRSALACEAVTQCPPIV